MKDLSELPVPTNKPPKGNNNPEMWKKIMAVHIEKKIKNMAVHISVHIEKKIKNMAVHISYARHFEIIIKECMQRKTRR
jgi:hypothetical protein